ncbi:hypothetical protein ILFOPFJJ_01585 [Ensifer psoraleae]|nr:hypothetical protein [Sinorhizobium psoraleae]
MAGMIAAMDRQTDGCVASRLSTNQESNTAQTRRGWISCALLVGRFRSCAFRALAGGAGHFLRTGQQAFALEFLAGELPVTAHGFRLFAHALFGRLFVGAARLHFAENAFALHLLLQNAKGLLDVIIPDENLQSISFLSTADAVFLHWLYAVRLD